MEGLANLHVMHAHSMGGEAARPPGAQSTLLPKRCGNPTHWVRAAPVGLYVGQGPGW